MSITTIPTIERRFVPQAVAPVGIQARADGTQVIAGYAAVYYRADTPGTEYEILTGLAERIARGAFDRALRERDDVRGLFNHDPDNLLARLPAGTLRLSADEIGLSYEITIDPDDADHQRVVRKIERGDLTGSSFAFSVERATWIEEEDRDIRIIESVRLYDVGPVTYPAYEATTTGLRSGDSPLEAILADRERWRNEREAVRVRLRRIELDQA